VLAKRGDARSLQRWRLSLLAALAVALLSALVASSAIAATPRTLYTALLTTAYPDSQLPSGFSSAKISLQTPGKNATHYHAVGEVAVEVLGPDPNDGIGYVVFANNADALGDLNHPTLSTSGAKIRIVPGGVPGLKLPGHMWTGALTGTNGLGKKITDGLTLVAVVDHGVLVDAYTDSASNTESGNIPAAIALLRSAIRHLNAVESKH